MARDQTRRRIAKDLALYGAVGKKAPDQALSDIALSNFGRDAALKYSPKGRGSTGRQNRLVQETHTQARIDSGFGY